MKLHDQTNTLIAKARDCLYEYCFVKSYSIAVDRQAGDTLIRLITVSHYSPYDALEKVKPIADYLASKEKNAIQKNE